MMSVIVPVYRNSETVDALLEGMTDLNGTLGGELEVVFVVDGSPDDSHERLRRGLANRPYRAQLLELSRNFGSFAAIRAGMEAARGNRFAVLAADLQEPPELVVEFDRKLRTESCDIVVGTRISRTDPLLSRLGSATFWGLYRRWVQREIPEGGVDVFGCSKQVRDQILTLTESNSSLIGLLFWIGFRRQVVPYVRRPRLVGRSAWTFAKKLRYLSDSVFNFTDLPVRVLFWIPLQRDRRRRRRWRQAEWTDTRARLRGDGADDRVFWRVQLSRAWNHRGICVADDGKHQAATQLRGRLAGGIRRR
jgi:glycosyltransferase involved in cell wall biosynthesis